MKKILSFVAALMIATTATAQTAMELARQQQELNAINMKMLNAKPTKQAKKQAKELKGMDSASRRRRHSTTGDEKPALQR